MFGGCPSRAMKVEMRLVWGECVLPLESQKLDFVNIADVEGLADEDQLDFQLLSLKSHATWIASALSLPHSWWRKYQKRIPFLNEVLVKIKNLKSKKRRLPNAVVAIEVRGGQVLLQNTPRNVNLAFKGAADVDALQWFLDMLEEDIKYMRTNTGNEEVAVGDETLGAKSLDSEQDDNDEDIFEAKADGVETLGAAEDAIVAECLESIRNNPQCKKALYFPSRFAFEVTKKGIKKPKQFTILQFKMIKKKYGSSSIEMRTQCEAASMNVLKYLSGDEEPEEHAAASAAGSSETLG